jgi:hypothetical protein
MDTYVIYFKIKAFSRNLSFKQIRGLYNFLESTEFQH